MIKFNQGIVENKKVKCRYLSVRECPETNLDTGYMLAGTKYISISGYGARGPASFCICESCSVEFFKQFAKAKSEFKKFCK